MDCQHQRRMLSREEGLPVPRIPHSSLPHRVSPSSRLSSKVTSYLKPSQLAKETQMPLILDFFTRHVPHSLLT
jgi:hypothetical protein